MTDQSGCSSESSGKVGSIGQDETWIEWLERLRKASPDCSLHELLHAESSRRQLDSVEALIDTADLADLACVDLIIQYRAGQRLRVEAILEAFPQLRDSTHCLDLIDAELCIRRELIPARDPAAEIEEYSERFPDLATPISELIGLSSGEPAVLILEPSLSDDVAESTGAFTVSPGAESIGAHNAHSLNTNDQSLDMSFSEPVNGSRPAAQDHHLSHPIELPEWFIGQQCVATEEGCWLIRGRDVSSNTTLAMKIIKLPSQIGGAEADLLLDHCEAAAKVKNPVWIAPSVAAIQNRHLAVIRPWIFGTPWQAAGETVLTKRLRQLASVAYALAAAHSHGAVHGAVHANNLIVKHDGEVALVDAVSSQTTVCQDSTLLSVRDHASLRRSDAQDLIKLVMIETIDFPGSWSDQLQTAMQQFVTDQPDESCGIIGDELMRRSNADHAAPKKSWRSRLSTWINDRS